MNINLRGTNLELTSDLREQVREKIGSSLRAFGSMNLEPAHIDIELERTTRRHLNAREREQLYRAEATVSLRGHTFRVEESAMELDLAIVQLKHTLTRDIRKWRERIIENGRKGARKAKQRSQALEESPSVENNTEEWEEDI